MRNYLERYKGRSIRQYFTFGGVFFVMTINDVLLGLHILDSVTLPILIVSSLLLKGVLFVGAMTLIRQHTSLLERSEIDVLTKAYTRDVFFTQMSELIRAQGGDRPKEDVSIILFDLDDFKNINDNLGHQIGDRVLSQVSATARTVIRHDDIFARLGGEEFGILLPRTSGDEALKLAERLRLAINAAAAKAYRVSASFGVAAWNGQETIDQLYARTDALMYKAKYDGKNRVVGE